MGFATSRLTSLQKAVSAAEPILLAPVLHLPVLSNTPAQMGSLYQERQRCLLRGSTGLDCHAGEWNTRTVTYKSSRIAFPSYHIVPAALSSVLLKLTHSVFSHDSYTSSLATESQVPSPSHILQNPFIHQALAKGADYSAGLLKYASDLSINKLCFLMLRFSIYCVNFTWLEPKWL